MSPTISAFKQSPDRGQGLARDMRVRWALEEVGQPYNVKLVAFPEMKEDSYRALHPFGQIPIYQDGDLLLFESGAIVLHIAETHPGLLPKDKNAHARVITWMFAALGTVEPAIVERSATVLFDKEKSWYQERLTSIDQRIRTRLSELSKFLGHSEWLVQDFSAADIMMVHVLQRLESSGLLNEFANVKAYVERAKARPAYQRAFQSQLKVYQDSLAT